jgi:peroxiredoxin
LQALYEKFKHKGLVVLGVSVDRAGMEKIIDYVKHHKLSFPNLHDSALAVGKNYRVNGVPMTYIINIKGNIVGVAVGTRPWMSEDSQKLVQQLLTEIK